MSLSGVGHSIKPYLRWAKVIPEGRAPVCAHPDSDLGYDLFAAEPALLVRGRVTKVRTGIAVEFSNGYGAIIKDRSSMAAKGIKTSAGVLDAGYRGEIVVLLTLDMDAPPTSEGMGVLAYKINVGDKIAQMKPELPQTRFIVEERGELTSTERGAGGFGSTGK